MNFTADYEEPADGAGAAAAAAAAAAPAENNRGGGSAAKGQANVSPGKGDISSDDLQEL
jgi:hypothetical protein